MDKSLSSRTKSNEQLLAGSGRVSSGRSVSRGDDPNGLSSSIVLGGRSGNSIGMSPKSSAMISLGNRSANGGSFNVTSRKSPTISGKIYAWEDEVKKERESIDIEGKLYYPTRSVGFYSAEEEQNSDSFCDFQIVLTLEELTTLAARRKAERYDTKLHRNQAAAQSVHASTPYIDPRRVAKELLRQNHKEKWMDTDGVRPNRKL